MKGRNFRQDLQTVATALIQSILPADTYLRCPETNFVGVLGILGLGESEYDEVKGEYRPEARDYAGSILQSLQGFFEGAYLYGFPKADNTVDAVVFGIEEDRLKVLLVERGREGEPFFGCWALPGGFIKMEEDLETALRRELEEETGLTLSYVEQLRTFGRPGRDPRGRVISTAYLGLVRPSEVTVVGQDDAAKAAWFPLSNMGDLGVILGLGEEGLAFDHAEIIQAGIDRLRSKISWQPVGIELLPEEFTLSELQRVYEIILNKSLDPRNFRTRVLRFGVLAPTGNMRKGRHRPAKLYHFDRERYDRLREQGSDFEV